MNTSTAKANASGTSSSHNPIPIKTASDRRDLGGAADESAEDIPRPLAGAVDRGPYFRAEALQDPGPEGLTVAEDEVEHRDGEHETGDDPGTRLHARGGVAGRLSPRLFEWGLEIFRLLDREAERLALELRGEVVDGFSDGGDELVELLDDGDRHDRDEHGHERERHQESAAAGVGASGDRGTTTRWPRPPARSSRRPPPGVRSRRYQSSASTAATAAAETRSRQLQAAARSTFSVVGGSCIGQSTVVRA
jgi:hypothetical protein